MSSPYPLLLSFPQFLVFLQHLQDHVPFMFQQKGEVQILLDLLHWSLSLHSASEISQAKMLHGGSQKELHCAAKCSSFCNVLGCWSVSAGIVRTSLHCFLLQSSVSSDKRWPPSGNLDEVKQTQGKVSKIWQTLITWKKYEKMGWQWKSWLMCLSSDQCKKH